jgi:hypothetical protein
MAHGRASGVSTAGGRQRLETGSVSRQVADVMAWQRASAHGTAL